MSLITSEKAKVTSSFHFDTTSFVVSLSDAEAQVIRHKAKKAKVSVNEYIRNAALGFPMC
ncbi:MAG: hypothetical protein AAF652_01960 [Cyanobacteria bacterium P01_C01_bin.72]